jgi:Zn-dependent M28 family amino/carboxypeptidase
MYRLSIVFLFLVNAVSAQKVSKADKEVLKYLEANVVYLASDKLEGRRAGTQGETLAAEFISSKFKEIGLLPKGSSDSYFQPFTVSDGKQILQQTTFSVNSKSLIQGVDFFPISNSPQIGLVKAQISPSLTERDQPWMVDIADDLNDNKDNPHFDISAMLISKITKAKEKGASAVILFNSGTIDDKISFDSKDRSEPLSIPVIYITKEGIKKHLSENGNTYDISFSVATGPKLRNTKNVVGYIDNNTQLTVVLGAHFDHLGYGEDGNSMMRTGEVMIHNGADDNASGTSALIELAFLLKKSKAKQYNYLFIAFSAEELGLNGSKYFVENPTISLNSVNYMINMDMVGRMNDSSKTITVGGYGTSPAWKTMIDGVKKKTFNIRYDSSGSGPSDHTSFYRKDIPVLFFFTGLHTDYHKPSDDADKINYMGQLQIVKFIQQLIEGDKQQERLAFLKTREQQTSTSARFSVSMGIMPDYTFSGNGVRVDGVSENRPAKKAGITAGDIVKQMGDFKTSSVESYMQVLSKFKKGDKTVVTILRGDKEISFEIIF